jgi:hypothetical protein
MTIGSLKLTTQKIFKTKIKVRGDLMKSLIKKVFKMVAII